MAFQTIGGGAKILKATSLKGKEGFVIEGYYMGLTTSKFNNSLVLVQVTKPFSLEQVMGDGPTAKKVMDDFKTGDRISISGGGMLVKRASLVPEGTLCQFTYEGENLIEGDSKFKGKMAHCWEVAMDTTRTIHNSNVPKNIASQNCGDDCDYEDDEEEV